MDFKINVESIRHLLRGSVADFEDNAIKNIKKQLPDLKSTGIMPLVEPSGMIRRSGKSIRHVDFLIQKFFNEGEVRLSAGQMAEHENRIFRERLQREHPNEYKNLIINTKYHVSLIVPHPTIGSSNIGLPFSFCEKYHGENIMNLLNSGIRI